MQEVNMPKENTHIAFAARLFDSLDESPLKEALAGHKKEYLLGSISPDIFFYHRNEKKTEISSRLHGCAGEKTNEIIIAMLEDTDTPRKRDFSFAAGYMTHTVLDMTFHPVVYYLSGNYYDPDFRRREQSQYRHRYIETVIDIMLAGALKSHRELSPALLRGLAFTAWIENNFDATGEETALTLKRQLFLNRLMTGHIISGFLSLFAGNESNRSLFYGHIARKDRRRSPAEKIYYRDIFTGEKKETSWSELFDEAVKRALPRLEAMYRYSMGEIKKEKLKEHIPGESLDTGSTGRTIKDMNYSILDTEK